MQSLNIGLNGFGRIGRSFTRILLNKELFNLRAINTGSTTPEVLAYLLKHDSLYKTFNKQVGWEQDGILIEGKKTATYNIRDPEKIPWDKHKVDVVVDATGVFKRRQDLEKHLRGTVKRVVLTAPTNDPSIAHLVLGVNDDQFDFDENNIVSNASCTTNCAAVMYKVLNDNFHVVSGFLTTTHSYTTSQVLLDNKAKRMTRSRAAGLSIIPTTTGAAKAIEKVISDLKGKTDAIAIRVPTPVGSISDISVLVEKEVQVEEVNNAFKTASEASMTNILGFESEPLVSSDYIGSSYSCIYDPNYTKVINKNLIKVFGWYDNEWGYSSRLVDLVEKISQTI